MPRRPAAPCTHTGCPNLKPCPEHQRPAWAGSTRRRRLPPDWPKTQARILDRDQHRCRADEHDPRCNGTATEVDHINRGDDHSAANLRAINTHCHAIKSSAEGAAARWGGGRG